MTKTASPTHGNLTARELDVARMLALGHTCHEIGAAFGISVKTADTHRGRVLKKLNLRNTAELARYAIRHGIAPLEQT